MFDIGFAELVIIAVVALLVIGPERLPDAVRTASAWINRFRRGFNEIKQEVQQELHNDAVMRELRESGEKLRRETEALRQDLNVTDLPGAQTPTGVDPTPHTLPEQTSTTSEASAGAEHRETAEPSASSEGDQPRTGVAPESPPGAPSP